MHMNVHSSFIYSDQKPETAQSSINKLYILIYWKQVST